MNDFTKEELDFINAAINPFNWIFSGDFDELKSKLKSLIDNYCEHDYLAFLVEENHNPFIEKCGKCDDLRFYTNE